MKKDSISLLLIYLLFQPLIIIILSMIYLINGGNNLESFMMSDSVIIIILIFLLLLMGYMVLRYKFKNRKVKKRIYLLAFLIGLSLSFVVNYIFKYNLGIVSNTTINLYIYFISSCILGPITEEYLFRGILYHDLRERNSKRKSMILVTILFTLVHFNLYKMFFAFIMGSLLIILLNKYQNIYLAIICHMGCNIMGFLFLTLL